MELTDKSFIRTERSVLLWLCLLWGCAFSSALYGQTSRVLYVGQSTFLVAPDPPGNAALSQTAWGCSHGAVSCRQDGVYGAEVTVNEYFEGIAQVQCDYYYYWYDLNGYMHTNHATTYFNITCRPVTLRLQPTEMVLNTGEGAQLSYTLSPSIVSPSPRVRMISRNTTVATVSSNGYVRAVEPGVTYIDVENSAGPGASCQVTVVRIDPTSVEIPSSLSAYVGEGQDVKAQLYPSNATATLSWYSENTSIAMVSSGRLTGRGEGTAYIYAKTDKGLVSNRCRVDVAYRKPSSVAVSPSTLRLPIGQESVLQAVVSPSNAKYTLSWSSDRAEVASVSSDGRVTAHAAGTACIRATTDNGRVGQCTVTVPPDPESIALSGRVSMMYGKSRKLRHTVVPADAYVSLTWTSADPAVASVSADGEVTARMPGETDVTVRTHNGREAVCQVEVERPVYQFNVWMADGGKLSYDLAEHPVLTYADGALRVATHREQVELDTADVHKFTFEDLTQERMPESIVLPEALELPYKQDAVLEAQLLPAAYDIETVLTWTSSAPDIVRVGGNGRVKAVGVGEALVSVEASNGTKAACRVTVPEPDYHLFVWRYDGTYDAFAFKEHPVVTCTGDVVRVTTRDGQIEYAEKDVHKYTFSDTDEPSATAVRPVAGDASPVAQRMEREGQEVRMYGHTPGSVLRVYGADGRLYAERRASADGIITFSLSGLPAGLYVFQTKNITYKIIKQ